MPIIVNGGSTFVVPSTGLTLADDLLIEPGGTLLADQGGTITGGFSLTNDGVISVESPTGLTIDTASFTNQGTIQTFGGGSIVIQSSVNLTNLNEGTLTGGTWLNGGFHFLAGTISTVNATLTEFSDSDLEVAPGGTGTQSILNTITEIGSGGTLALNNLTWATPLSLSVDGTFSYGTVNVGASVLSATGGVTISATGTASLHGELVSPLTLNGSLIAQNNLQLDSTISGIGNISVNRGFLALNGAGTLAQPVMLNSGFITASGGTMTIAGPVSGTGVNNFWISESDPSVSIGLFIQEATSVSSINALELGSATNVNVAFGPDAAFGLVFPFVLEAPREAPGPKFGELILDQPGGFGGFVDDFDNNDTIVLKGIVGNTATWNGNLLTVMNNATTVYTMGLLPLVAQFSSSSLHNFQITTLSQDYSGATFVATPDNINNNTTITASGIQDLNSSFSPPCFGAGTRIRTQDGPVAVEDLSLGDLVTTLSGRARQVVWIGHREADCRRHPNPQSVWPVRISPDSFAPGQPHSELYLSPDHAVFVDEVLIPVRMLINGTTIRSIETSRVTWYHVELEDHDVVFAEGLPVESYLDQDDRGFFINGGGPVRLHPSVPARTWEMAGCAPLVVTGIRLARVRTMLEKRALDEMFLGQTTRAQANGRWS